MSCLPFLASKQWEAAHFQIGAFLCAKARPDPEAGERELREASARARDGERVPEKNIKTVSVLLRHADAPYTLDLYAGFIPATTRGAREPLRRQARPRAHGWRGKHGLKEDSR